MKVVLIFIDGLGIGEAFEDRNPCVQSDLKVLNNYRMPDGRLTGTHDVIALDANLGVLGLPQSATGQSTLLTGLNTAKLLGRHLQGFPNQTLRGVLKERCIPVRLEKKGLKPVFINAYRPEFFTLPAGMQWRLSVTTVVNLAANLPFKTLADVENGQALYHDFTNQLLIERGFRVPLFTPEQAGSILAALSEDADFLFYEYFLTDRAGHLQDMHLARRMIHLLDRFLSAFFNGISAECITILTSDHGNIEDLSTKTHTRNPVMTLVRGDHHLSGAWSSIQDIAPAILHLFGIDDG
jgi:2,3-bisphosphoglycerate-independent phosphoglycerate mutase